MTTLPRVADGLPSTFLSRLAGFIGLLRRRGLAAGIGAELDLGRALGHTRLLDREAFLDACLTTLAKSPSDLALLEEVFRTYWSPLPPGPNLDADVSRSVVPTSPPADGLTAYAPPLRQSPLRPEDVGVVRIGLYSPEAPSSGHPIVPLDSRRLAALRSGARRFRRVAASLPGRRFEAGRRGTIDFPATMRSSLRYGGEFLKVRRRRRKILRAELMILWDVSGSMREHDNELFALVYWLHRTTRRTRVFAFSTHLEEITAHVRGRPYARARDAVSRSLDAASGGTQIGRCLEDFCRRFGAFVQARTALVILSDGWDLGRADVLGRTLGRLRRRASLLAWVNPYARRTGFQPATAAMREAIRHADLLLAPEDFGAAGFRAS